MTKTNSSTEKQLKYGVEKDTVIRRYEAEAYDHDMERYLGSLDSTFVHRMDTRIQHAMLKILSEKGNCRIFVPAVGSGRVISVFEPFLHQKVEIEGIDFNARMMCKAETLINDLKFQNNIRLSELDIFESLDEFKANSFDLIVWEYSGCVVNSPFEAWKIMSELLSPGGFIVYNDYIGAKDQSIIRNQHVLRDAARTIGMRWFRKDELPEGIDSRDKNLICTNGIFSANNEGKFANERSIVWDPTYAFYEILSSNWLCKSLDTVEIEIKTLDIMQSNVSAVFHKPDGG